MPNYIPSGGIQNGQIIFDNHVYNIIGALNGASGSDINMGRGILFVSSSNNVGINITTPLPGYQLVVNGKQYNNNELRISGSGAELYVNSLATSSGATNFVTYNPTSGKFFTTSSNILGQYLLVGQTSSMLAPYLLIAQTSSMLAPYLLVAQTGAFATTASNIFNGNQIISGNLTVTGSTNLTGLTPGVGGGFILTYDNSTGQIFYTQSISALTPPDLSGYLLITQTSSMLAPYLLVNQTGAFATTASNQFNGNQIVTGSLTVSGGLTTLFNTRATGSFTGSFIGNLTGTASYADSASQALTASYVPLVPLNSNTSIDYYNINPNAITIGSSIGISNIGLSAGQVNTLNFGDFITASVAPGSGIANIRVSSSILGGVQIYDDGSNIGPFFALNFADNITVSDSGSGVANVVGTIRTSNNGSIQSAARILNFTGAGINSVTVVNGTASVNIPAQSGVEVRENGALEGTATTLDFVGATVGFSSGTASVSYPNAISGVGVQNASSTIVPTATSLIFSGSGVTVTQVNTSTASIHIPGGAGSVGGVNGNIQYNSGSTLQGATIFNFISSSNQVQLTGSLIVSNSGGTYILSSSGAVFSSSLYATSSVFFTGLTTTSSVSNILTFNPISGQLYYTSSDEYQQIKVKYNANITSSRVLNFTGSGVTVTYSADPVTASIDIPSYINPGPTGYLAFYSGSTSQSLFPVSASNQIGVFWDIAYNRLGINKITPEYTLEVSGSFGATTKSFIIPHKTQEGKYLQYGVTEGPEHSVFVRGKSNSHIIELPEEWEWLVDQDTITVNLTSVGEYQNLHILDITDNKVIVGSNTSTPNFHYQVFAERKDVPKLKTII
jgi:hypothetical protein